MERSSVALAESLSLDGAQVQFTVINKDRLVSETLDVIRIATEGWLNGPPQEEVALLSRITEQFGRRRRGCDVGSSRRVSVTPEVEVWHRRGAGGTDRYGCDIAVTLDIPDEPFRKTACFQLKRSNRGSVAIDPNQVQSALGSKFAHAAFLLATDVQTGVHFVAPMLSLATTGSHTPVAGWLSLSDWFVRWLDCQIGTPPDQGSNLETLLRELFVGGEVRAPWALLGLPEGTEPLRAWLQMHLSTFE